MAYSKLVDNIALSIDSQFNEISTRYNFDYGDEFEIAICELLKKVIPEQYGVCRGFIVTENDEFAGDDIVIFDKSRYPTMRLLDKDKMGKKQEIPVEAVYAYLEAKHTLILSEPENGQSIYKAFEQVNKVKRLPRESRDLVSIDPYNSLSKLFTTNRGNWPKISNPMYGVIISRFVKNKTSSTKLLSKEIMDAVTSSIVVPEEVIYPDLVVMGGNDLLFPAISKEKSLVYESPFFVEGISTLIHRTTRNSALSIGIITLLYALDTIKLDKMPYQKILMEQLK